MIGKFQICLARFLPERSLGDPLIEGLDAIVSTGETELVVGAKIELSPLEPAGLQTSFFMLTAGAAALSLPKFHVVDRGLRVLNNRGELEPYDGADYMLCSVSAKDRRDDISKLPFAPLAIRALRQAGHSDENSWNNAKAVFVELIEQLLKSPDLTQEQSQNLIAMYKTQLLEVHQDAIWRATL